MIEQSKSKRSNLIDRLKSSKSNKQEEPPEIKRITLNAPDRNVTDSISSAKVKTIEDPDITSSLDTVNKSTKSFKAYPRSPKHDEISQIVNALELADDKQIVDKQEEGIK